MSAQGDQSHVQVRRLDDPVKLFFFGQGQVYAFLLFFSLGGMANSPLIGSVVGFFAAAAIGKTGSKYHRAFWRHCLYWFTPTRLGMVWLPESSDREFLR
jgi:hypothetical protein